MSSRSAYVLAALAWVFLGTASAAEPAESPRQLIKDVVFNELNDHQHHGFFAYRDSKRTGQQTVVKEEVETREGRVSRLLSTDGNPLTAAEQQQEARRLLSLLQDRAQQQKLLSDYQADEDRIGRIVSLLPEGFLFEYEGTQGGTIRLKYWPNPAFNPPSYEARVFHAMSGTVWIDAREKRLIRLEGQLVSNVDFGYGLLGRLDKGGIFDMQRVEVAPEHWKTRRLDVHIKGHVILLKCVSKDQQETRSDFRQVPPDLSLRQAEAVLDAPIENLERSAHFEPAGLRPGDGPNSASLLNAHAR